jgi:hypothetical protein
MSPCYRAGRDLNVKDLVRCFDIESEIDIPLRYNEAFETWITTIYIHSESSVITGFKQITKNGSTLLDNI